MVPLSPKLFKGQLQMPYFLDPFIHWWTIRLFPYKVWKRLLWTMLPWTWSTDISLRLMISFLLDIYPEVGLLGHMLVLFLIPWGTSIPFYIVAVWVYIPTNSVQGFPFFHILPAFIIPCLIANRYPNRYEVISHYGFDLHFPDD